MLFAFYRIPLTNSVRFMDMVLCLFREVTVILDKLNTTSSDHIQPGKTLKLKGKGTKIKKALFRSL